MKKRTTLVFGFIAMFSTVLLAQENVNVYWGKTNPEDRFSHTQLLGKMGNYLFGVKYSTKTVSLIKYDLKDLQVKGEYPLIGKSGKTGGKVLSPHDYTYQEVLMLKHHMYLSVEHYERKTKTNSLYLQEINAEGKLTGSLKKMQDVTGKSKWNRGGFSIIPSEDSTKILLVEEPPYEKYSGEKFGFNIYNEDLTQTSKVQVELPYQGKYFSTHDYALGSDGNIYMMAQIFLERENKKKGESRYYNQLIEINPQGQGQVTQYDIKLPEKDIVGISYTPEDNNDVICAGFYGDIKSNSSVSKNGINGIFYMRLNKQTKQVTVSSTKELDKEFIADLTSEKKANKGKGISDQFTIRSFVRRSDGGSIIVAELAYYFVTTVTTSDGHGGTTTRTVVHFVRNNIIAININPDGTIKWYANIPKYQYTADDNGMYSSFMFMTKGDKMYFIYNDNPDNLLPAMAGKKPKDMGNPAKATAVLVELSEDGKFTKAALFNNKTNKVILMPSYFVQISDNELVAPAYNGGFWCCISFKAATSKLARFEFK